MTHIPWTREELILSLDLYLRLPRKATNRNHPEVHELSELLREMGRCLYNTLPDAFRSPSTVALRAAVWRSMHLDVVTNGNKGLSHSGELAREVWNDFNQRPERLATTAVGLSTMVRQGRFKALSTAAKAEAGAGSELPSGITEAREGSILSVQHLLRERNKGLVAEKKRMELARVGKLRCEACDLCFEDTYGKHGEGFIEVHHRRPISEYGGASVTLLADLALLCSNCHSMVHRHRDWLTMTELLALVRPRAA
jgi:5-methylcytosine-specific restriction protein A